MSKRRIITIITVMVAMVILPVIPVGAGELVLEEEPGTMQFDDELLSEDDSIEIIDPEPAEEPDQENDLNGNGAQFVEGDFKYMDNGNGTATLLGFSDTARDNFNPVIPAVAGGKAVTAIADNAFHNEHVLGVTLPDSIKVIGNWAFNGCYIKDRIVIPDGVETIGEKAFYGSTKYSNGVTLILGRRVRKIGASAFAQNGFEGDLKIPDSVETIGDRAFDPGGGIAHCFRGKLTLGKKVKTIGDRAFANCIFSGDLKIPDSVETIGEEAFYDAYDDNDRIRGKLTFGKNVRTIGNSAFKGRAFKGDLSLPKKLKKVGDSVFGDCEFTGRLTIPKGIKSIGDEAFFGCYFKGDLTIPDTTVTIGKEAFSNKFYGSHENFTGKLKLGKKVKTIGESAFYHCNFKGDLKLPKSVRTLKGNTFAYCTFNGTLTIPAGISELSETDFYKMTLLRKIANKHKFAIRAQIFMESGKETFVSSKGKKIGYNGKLTKGTYTKKTIKPTSVSLNKTRLQMFVGDSTKLTATVYPRNAFNRSVKWKSSNKKVATVSKSGKITAKKAGTAVITVTTKSGKKKKECVVTVRKPVKVKSVKLSDSVVYLKEGRRYYLTAHISPDNATNKEISWKSSNNSVATVSDEGVITAIKAGTAVITVKTQDGGKTATCTVTVE